MDRLVQTSTKLKKHVSKPPTTIGDFSPDDVVIVQKRQDWRLRAARICIEYFEGSDKAALVTPRRSLTDLRDLAARFARISDYVQSELASILVTGVTVHELEAVRYQANYFLEEIVRLLRYNIQQRFKTKDPLQSSSQEDIEYEVRAALQGSDKIDALYVFIDDIVKLAQFELEVGNQRERIRLLLGSDRRLSGLGNNEAIMTAPPDKLIHDFEEFTNVYSYLRDNLPPILDKASPYPALEQELKTAREQLRHLERERVLPFEARFQQGMRKDAGLVDLEARLGRHWRLTAEILDTRVAPLLRRASPPNARAFTISDRARLAGEVRELVESLLSLLSRPSPFPLPGVHAAIKALDPPPEITLSEIENRLLSLQAELDAAIEALRQAREKALRPLKEHFCALLGELRTFLQTSFAHIAAKDPRSTESSYHFFLREFSNEAQQAMLLLNEIRSLESLIGELQLVNIAGLRLTPENLARILRVLFVEKDEEKKRIPSGEGWKVMSSYLERLRDALVPRLQKICAHDGIRYEDKNFLSEWAMDLAKNCTLCLTQHEIGYNLLQEMGRLREDPDTLTSRQSHAHIVTTQTCRAMQKSLTEICMTLTASIPYVGIMRGGIERRASVFFHRQKRILESEPVSEAQESGGSNPTPPAEGATVHTLFGN